MAKFIHGLANYSNKNSLANRFRDNRFKFFEEQIKKLSETKPVRILDIGGTQSFWVNRGYADNENFQITILNLYKEETDYSNLIGVKGNACDLSEFVDNEFDLVFSNSVIEHVFSFENQQAMAAEVQRVGKNYYIQTPNRFFFVEPHYLLPFFQFLPRGLKIFILTKTRLSRGSKRSLEAAEASLKEIRLLSFNEMKQLFPKGKIFKEKFLLMNKSFTSYLISD